MSSDDRARAREGVTEIRGPSAIGGESRRFLRLTWTLSVLEFRLRFFGSVFGYLWQLMRPLMLFGVLYVVFTEVVRLGNAVKFYPVVLLLAIVLHTFFAEATAGAVPSVLVRENLVRKIQFPRLVIPVSVVLTALMNFVLNLGAIAIFIVASGVGMRLTALELVPLVAILALFSLGLAMALSALYVRYRDVAPIWEVLIPVSFYGSPVIYPLETVDSETLRHLIMCNPVAAIIQQARHALLDPQAMSAAEAIGGAPRLLIPAVIVVITVVIGYVIFSRAAPHIAEEL